MHQISKKFIRGYLKYARIDLTDQLRKISPVA